MLKKELEEIIAALQIKINAEEKETNKDSLAIHYKLYQEARDACVAATELLEDINQHLAGDAQQETYQCLLEGLKKIKNVIQFPSIENAEALISYTTNNSAYSEKDIHDCKMERFKARALQIAGLALLIGSIVAGFLFTAATGGWSLVGMFFGTLAVPHLLQKGQQHLNHARETEHLFKEKVESPFNKTKYAKSQNFLTHLASVGESAEMIGGRAHFKLAEQRDEEEHKALMNFMKVQAC